MVGMYLSAIAICAAAGAIGQLVCVLGGASGWSWLAPGAGLAALLCLASIGVRLPGHGWTAFALIAVAVLGALLALRGRVSLRDVKLEAWAAALVVLGLAGLPFLLHGRFGPLGAQVNDDLGFHMPWAEALATGREPAGLPGYPLGPHALAAAFTQPFGSVLSAFSGLVVAAPVLTALTALAGLRDLGRRRRAVAAVLVGMPYLVAAYFVQASFKELLMALLLLAFVLALGQLGPRPGWRCGLVPGVLGVATLLVYGPAGIVWPLAATAAWLTIELAAGRRAGMARVRELLPPLGCAATIVAVGALVQIDDLLATYEGIGRPATGALAGAGGNFFREISPLTISGGWTAVDFRLPPRHPASAHLAAALASVAALYGAWWWSVRRQLTVPAAVGACLVIYLWTRHTSAPYYSSKALVIGAPLVILMSARAVLAVWPESGRSRRTGRMQARALARGCFVIAFVTVVALSTLTQFRYSQVGPLAHARELMALRPLLARGPTLFLGRDDYQRWELFGVPFTSVVPYGPCRRDTCCDGCGRHARAPASVPRAKSVALHVPIDFDSVVPAALDRFRYAVTTRATYASRPPPWWHLVRRGRFYDVWERAGPSRPRTVLSGENGAPGAILDCRSPSGSALSRLSGRAAVRPVPVFGPWTAWRPSPHISSIVGQQGYAVLKPGSRLTQVLRLARGRWTLDLQYESSVALTVAADGKHWHLPAASEPHGQLWPVGTLVSRGRPVKVSVTADRARFSAPAFDGVGLLTADRGAGADRTVPLRQACGRYVDWFEPR